MRLILFFLFVALISIRCSTDKLKNIKFERLLCEYAENPINIDIAHPRFSWVVSSTLRNQRQSAYQVLVASSVDILSEGNGDCWHSNKIISSETMHLPYDGKALKSNANYFWKVRIWDGQGRMFESSVNHFSTAFLYATDWKAKWIGANSNNETTPKKGFFMDRKEETEDSVHHIGRSILLRHQFMLDKPIQSAKLFITGLGFYESELNGKKIGTFVLTPGKTPYHKEILYDTYDITNDVKQGANAIGIHLGNGWYDPYKKWWDEYRMQWFGYKKALAQIHITYQDGSEAIICTDENWKTARGPVLYNCVYDGEVYDANEELTGWSLADFDDRLWQQAVLMKTPGATLISQTMPAIEVIEIRKPVRITEPQPGMMVYDLGQNFTGWVRMTMTGEKGTRLKIRFSEELYKDGTLNYTCNEHAKATIEYVLKGDSVETYQPHFTYFGFQYVEITSDKNLPKIHELEGCVIHSANEKMGDFTCSNDLINKMHHATVWSQKSNMLSYPMDCPQRDERLGWMGDAQVTAEEAMFNFDMALFYQNWFRGIRANQDEETGDIPIISPRPYIQDEGIEWSSSYINMVWNHYRFYGDVKILDENYPAMKRYMAYLGELAQNYILPKGWIGDWGSMVKGWEEGEPESIPTAFYYYNAVLLQKCAQALENEEDAQFFHELAASIKHAYNETYFNPETNNYNHGSQMANAFPLYLGLVPEDKREAVIENLVHDIEVTNNTHLTTGVLGTKYLIDALSNEGKSDVAWALATQTTYPSWAEMMKRFNTMCEFWTLKQSHNHVMMGSIDAWFYKSLAGIQLVEEHPAFEEIAIKPYFAEGLNQVNASTNTLRGRVTSNWEKTGEGYMLEVEIPFNCSGLVYIPRTEDMEIFEGDVPLSEVQEIISIEHRHAFTSVKVPSGVYQFRVKQ